MITDNIDIIAFLIRQRGMFAPAPAMFWDTLLNKMVAEFPEIDETEALEEFQRDAALQAFLAAKRYTFRQAERMRLERAAIQEVRHAS
jgi:hypothetical protein